jgi:membrane-associated phospholipid phosphatase
LDFIFLPGKAGSIFDCKTPEIMRMKSIMNKLIGEISLNVLIVSVLFILAVFTFGFLVHRVIYINDTSVDSQVFAFFKSYTTPNVVNVMNFFTFFGSMYFIFPAYIVLLIYLVIKHKRTEAINIAIVAITSSALMFGLKEFFKRQRPDLPVLKALTNFSFPSGHALSSFIFCSVIIYLIVKSNLQLRWKWFFGVLLILFSVLIGISRIVLRYHFATDVMAGFCLGFAWVILSLWVERRLTPRAVERELDTPV